MVVIKWVSIKASDYISMSVNYEKPGSILLVLYISNGKIKKQKV